ncbi:DUF6764 family protein [Nocardia brasiliensis]|uniref:DUF6764 family protein n=1 Tax=Nocardia brasiliensis TaxID=37326 RepID=UPI00245751DF|nr:DUF6764 family protein [Nocardia brasiliensis]
MFHNTSRRLTASLLGLGLSAVGAAWIAAPHAAAAPAADCRAPGASRVVGAADGSQCAATSVDGSAAAAFGFDGAAYAEAGPASLALAQNGGTATARSQSLAGPAAIAIGPGATVDAAGVRPGLSIAIAGPGATVELTGQTGPTCRGGLAFAGDFQTLQGCLSTR